jgi:hypothetical protein
MTNNHERKKRKHAQADARKTEEEMETVDRLLSASANAIHSFHIESVKLQRDTEDNIKGLVRFRQQSSLFFTQVSNPDRGGVSSSGAINQANAAEIGFRKERKRCICILLHGIRTPNANDCFPASVQLDTELPRALDTPLGRR